VGRLQLRISVQEGPLIIGYSPLVFLSAFFAFAIPTVVFGRRPARTAAIGGLTLAVFVTYSVCSCSPGRDAVLSRASELAHAQMTCRHGGVMAANLTDPPAAGSNLTLRRTAVVVSDENHAVAWANCYGRVSRIS